MRNESLTEQLDQHLLQRRITREARESERVLLDHIRLLRTALQDLDRAYVSMMRSGYDRIIELGGDCDPPETMERGNPYLRQAREALEETK
jgi:hypothetical protein